MARMKKKNEIEVDNFKDVKDALVKTLNGLSDGSITPSVAKAQGYLLQTLLSALKQIHETEDCNQDSIRDLVVLIQQARDEKLR